MSSFSHWLIEEKWESQSGSSHLQGFFRNVYTNLKSFRTSCDTQASLIDTELSVFYMYLSNNSTRYISTDNVQEMINYLPQPDRHRTEETNYSADKTI